MFAARPDLMLTGRTLMGHDSAKNQQMDDHYFGAIPERVQAFMKDLEIQALELGIPCKTRHNEVAPNQFELAPIFEEVELHPLIVGLDGQVTSLIEHRQGAVGEFRRHVKIGLGTSGMLSNVVSSIGLRLSLSTR